MTTTISLKSGKHLILGLLLGLFSMTSHAITTSHSGANCQAANQAQANLMVWNKNGVENTHNQSLYIICPVDFDFDAMDATPSIKLKLTMWVPPKFGLTGFPGPYCAFRYMGTTEGRRLFNTINAQNSAVVNMPNFIGDSSYGHTMNGEVTLNNINTLGNPHAHLLCLLPGNGGTLHSYLSEQF